MRPLAWVLLLLAGCDSCRTSPTSSPGDAGRDAGIDAPHVMIRDASIPDVAAPPPALGALPVPLSVVAFFSVGVTDIHGVRLTDGIGIGQQGDHGWNVYTAGVGKPLLNLTALWGIAAPDDPLYIWGSTNEVWITTLEQDAGHALRTGKPKPTRVYRFVVPFAEGWVGVPSSRPPWYMSDDIPARFEFLRPGDKGELPVTPSALRLWMLGSLGDGKLCGAGYLEDGPDASPLEENAKEPFRVWYYGSRSDTRLIKVAQLESEALIKRGPNGECMIVLGTRGADLSVQRVQGSEVVQVIEHGGKGTSDVTNTGMIWLATEDHVLHRFDVTRAVEETSYVLPTDYDGCRLAKVDTIAAIADDDLWLLGTCEAREAAKRSVLLHTQRPPDKIRNVPLP